MNSIAIEKSIVYLFPVIIAVHLIQAFGYYNPYTPWVFALYYVVVGFSSFVKVHRHTFFKSFFLIWFFYILMSCFTTDLPIKYVTEEFKRFVAPTLFVFVGMFSRNERMYKVLVYSIFFSVIAGFFLMIIRPAWYVGFLINCYSNAWYSTSTENAVSIMLTAFRFQSFFQEPYAISYFVTFSLCIVMCDVINRTRIVKDVRILYAMIASFVIAIILSGFRVALAYMAILFLGIMLYNMLHRKTYKSNFTGAIVAIIVVLLTAYVFISGSSTFEVVSQNLTERLSYFSYDEAMEGSRTTQRERALDSWNNVVFGEGTGSRGAQARIDGLPAITDGGYIKMLVENGIVGVAMFSFIMLITLRKGIKNMKYFPTELLIIGYGLVSMIGANSLSMSWCYSLPFWFAVGRIWNYHMLQLRIKKFEQVYK